MVHGLTSVYLSLGMITHRSSKKTHQWQVINQKPGTSVGTVFFSV